jgi:hypothetical protein
MPRLANVNTTDLVAAVRLGCRTMQRLFNADDHDVPFFGSTVFPHAALWFSPDLSECHVPGRHLAALLAAEAIVGLPLDPAAVDKHRRALFFSFSGPLKLPLNRQALDGPLVNFAAHNLREGLHGLWALAAYRDDEQARALAEACLAEINRLWSPEDGWDEGRFRALGLHYQAGQGPLSGEARAIGPLVKYYRATGYGPALELALRLKELCLERFFWPDGAYDHKRFVTDHTHSLTSCLSSLAQLADLLGDAALLQRLRAFYDNGLWEMRDEIGWGPAGVFARDTDVGEANITGDIVETALILGRHGYPECYADAERILRCHLLPSQLRDVSFMRDAPNPVGIDGLRDAANRHLGAFGLPAPYGHQPAGRPLESIGFYMDIVGGAVLSLCAACEAVTRSDETGHWVNLHFDHDGPAVSVVSPYTGDGLVVTLKRPGPLWLRLPRWVAPAEWTLDGTTETPRLVNGYLFLAQPPVGTPLRLRFPLTETTLTLSTRVHPRPIRLRLCGDRPMAMDNFGADLTFFEPFMEPAAVPA